MKEELWMIFILLVLVSGSLGVAEELTGDGKGRRESLFTLIRGFFFLPLGGLVVELMIFFEWGAGASGDAGVGAALVGCALVVAVTVVGSLVFWIALPRRTQAAVIMMVNGALAVLMAARWFQSLWMVG